MNMTALSVFGGAVSVWAWGVAKSLTPILALWSVQFQPTDVEVVALAAAIAGPTALVLRVAGLTPRGEAPNADA